MNYESLIIRIKSCSCKLFLSNQFHLSGNRESFGCCIESLLKFSINEVNFDITQGKERYPKSNIYANVSEQKSLLKGSRPLVFVINQKKNNYHAKGLKPAAVNLLCINIGFLNLEVKFSCKIWLYCICLSTQVDEALIKCWLALIKCWLN